MDRRHTNSWSTEYHFEELEVDCGGGSLSCFNGTAELVADMGGGFGVLNIWVGEHLLPSGPLFDAVANAVRESRAASEHWEKERSE